VKSPGFWWREPGLAARLLQPFGLVYGAITAHRMARSGERAATPVICIGNVTVGGAGKTPAAIHVSGLLRELGHNPAFLTRGYGGTIRGPVLVDAARHGSAEVGDEPLLLARHAPAIVSRRRPAGAALAASIGADVIVMDDGLQNPSLQKSLTIAVFDGAIGVGNGLVLPAGPLRASLPAQWPHVDVALIIGEGERGSAITADARERALPVFGAALIAEPDRAARLRGRRVLAFAGIGRPDKFFETLKDIGAELAETRSFADHHAYSEREVSDLLAAAERAGLIPVTTEKDLVRLAGFAASEPRVGGIVALPVSLVLGAEDDLKGLLARALQRR
jgi:tetraacyldisaccharide 4'-kinase